MSNIRFDYKKFARIVARQVLYNVQCRAFTQIVDIGLVGKPETGNDRLTQP